MLCRLRDNSSLLLRIKVLVIILESIANAVQICKGCSSNGCGSGIKNTRAMTNDSSMSDEHPDDHVADLKLMFNVLFARFERATFLPDIFTANDGIGVNADTVLMRIAKLQAGSTQTPYSECIRYLSCKVAFSLVKLSSMCARAARLTQRHPVFQTGSSSLEDQGNP
ncbi:hypothetical protein GJ496_006149 [Pomphorhynchus laevis]|nr:hypothetical protein GJ496_006149 [Pomphorhynchus laevis]